MTAPASLAAIDLGASGGRAITGHMGAGTLRLAEIHRFPNAPVKVLDTLHWDMLALQGNVLDGLRLAAKKFSLVSVGIDSWAIDYGRMTTPGLSALARSYVTPRMRMPTVIWANDK